MSHSRLDTIITKTARATEELWRAVPSLKEKKSFESLLSNYNLTYEEFLQLLSTSPAEFSKHIDTLPLWVEYGRDLLETNSNPNKLSYAANNSISANELTQIVKHIVNEGESCLKRELINLEKSNNRFLISNELILGKFRQIIDESISEILIKPIVTEMYIAKRLGTLLCKDPETRYEEFLGKFSDPNLISNFLDIYPVAGRLSAVKTHQTQTVIIEMINRFYSDYEILEKHFGKKGKLGEIEAIEFGLGDSHKNGRTVAKFVFSSGVNIIYKPRSMEIDLHFQNLLMTITDRLENHKFKFPKIINRGSYGFMEFVEPSNCKSKKELNGFFYRHGFQLAVIYLMGGTDFHYENIIACGEYPILVDLETLMSPKVKSLCVHPVEIIADSLLKNSVLETGLLPFSFRFDPELEPIDISGLSNNNNQISPLRAPVWHEVGTDLMHLKREFIALPKTLNHPDPTNEKFRLSDYSCEIIAGFKKAFSLLKSNINEIKSLILGTKYAITRVVIRPTYIYAFLLRESYHPHLLGDALDRDRHFDQLWARTKTQPELKKIYKEERRDLWQGDIPYFMAHPNSKSLWSSRGEEISNFFESTSIDDTLQRLDNIDEENLIFQVWLIRLSLSSAALSQGVPIKKQGFKQSFEPNIMSIPIEIGDYIIKQAIISGREATWISLLETELGSYTPVIAGNDLYAGLPGIILFLFYLSEVSGQQKYHKIAKAGLNNLLIKLEDIDEQEISVGAFDGIGGVIYSLSHFGILLGDRSLFKLTKRFVSKTEKMLERNPDLDVISGVAGCILSLLAYHSASGDKIGLQIAKKFGDYLLKQKVENSEDFSWFPNDKDALINSGFGHGAMGIIYALHNLYLKSNIQKYRLPATQILTNFNSNDALTVNVTNGKNNSWCRGLSGSLGSLVRIYSKSDNEWTSNLLLNSDLAELDCICHGEMGNLDAIIGTKPYFSSDRIRNIVSQRYEMIVDRAKERGWFYGTPVESVGLMEGMAGIGYQLLRIAHPSKVPSILFLEPPVKRTKNKR